MAPTNKKAPHRLTWRRLLHATRTDLVAYTAAPGPTDAGQSPGLVADEPRCRVIHLQDERFEYPSGPRLDVIGADGSDAVDVELNPFGRYRVVASERIYLHGRYILALTSQPVR